MIRRVKDTTRKFFLVTVPASETYQLLYMDIPEIHQIQLVACQKKNQWEAIDWGSRTTIEKLPSKWTVDVCIEEIELDQIKQFCPSVCDIQYSTKMLEDAKIRKRIILKF